MLKPIEEIGEWVEITGFRDVSIGSAEEFLKTITAEKRSDVSVQFFNADLVATWQHLYFAALNALLAFRNRENISRSLEVEVILYASAERQIRKAIEFMGVKRSSANIALVLIAKKPESATIALSAVTKCIGSEPDETVLKLSKEKTKLIRKAFDISKTEIETVAEKNQIGQALVDLVIEKMALLPTRI
jgi:tRNA threonylcarbamoyladenosine modification (KEOPS) complex Cgi121 subunit